MKQFYEIDSSRVSLREYSWGTPWLLLPLIMIIKWLRIRMPSSTDDPPVDSLAPFAVSRDLLPVAVADKFQPLEDKLRALGFRSLGYMFIVDSRNATKYAFATWVDPTGKALAQIRQRVWTGIKPTRELNWVTFVTEFADGTFATTTNAQPDLLPPPTVRVQRLQGAGLDDLWLAHQQTLRAAKSPARQAFNEQEVFDIEERLHGECCDFQLARGIFREIETPPTLPAEPSALDVATSPHAAILTEMERLQRNQVSWGNFAFWLVLSFLIFAFTGIWQQSWKALAAIVGILFVHELGHYVTMRAFGYRNLRMFFIPFMGAAVSGQHYNVPGWKKVLVSLAGPVPGIFAGIAIGVAGLLTEHRELTMLGMLTIGLNGFNLLPILPLDGGWVVHATLFCRHPVFDAGFKTIAALGLIGLALLQFGWGLAIWGGLMLLALPLTYRLATLAARLRREGIVTTTGAAESIPRETAERIVSEVRPLLPAQTQPKVVAQHALNVFETLNARPPNWLVTILLLSVHAASLLIAIVGLLGLFLFSRGWLLPGQRPLERRPPQSVTVADVRIWRGADADQLQDETSTFAAAMPNQQQAAAYFDQLTQRLPAAATALQMGTSVIITVPLDDKEQERWEKEFQAKDKFAAYDPNWRILAVAPDDATAAKWLAESQHYLYLSHFELIPPWREHDPRSEDERAQHEQVRRFLHNALVAMRTIPPDDDLAKEMQGIMRKAIQVQDRDEIQKQFRDMQEKSLARAKAARETALEQLRSTATEEELLLLELIDRSTRTIGKDPDTEARAELRKQAGSSDDRREAADGEATREGLALELNVSTPRPDLTIPAILRQLEKLGCRDLKIAVGW